ncbi:MAG: HlyD family type I secretion periplasmic adaptor subunit [Gammaproteobacteria bacterium]|nr:HlyD family type I secretion periplasmic adaptor subunit [Gammaproteobacteria bacterium]
MFHCDKISQLKLSLLSPFKKISDWFVIKLQLGDQAVVTADNEAFPPVKKAVQIGILIIALFFGGGFLWSILFPIESGATMSGVVVVDSHSKTVQHLEGGIIKKIDVIEGSHVNKGQLLIELDTTQADANYDLVAAQQMQLEAKKARLIAERDNQSIITFPPDLMQSNSPTAKAAMLGEVAIFTTRLALLNKTFSILDQQIKQINDQISSLQAQATASERQLHLINGEELVFADLAARHLIEQQKLLALQGEQAKLTGDRDQNLSLIAAAQQKSSEVELQKVQLRQQREQEVAEDLQKTLSGLNDVQQKLLSSQDILTRTKITAPITGTVVDLKVHTIGGVIDPGAELMTIVPDNDTLGIDAKVNPLDIDVMRKGLHAKVEFVGLPRRSTPILNGIVDEVSAESLTDQRTGSSYYTARIDISKKELSRLGSVHISPGMPVVVLVVIDKRSFMGYLVEPVQRSFFKAFREN